MPAINKTRIMVDHGFSFSSCLQLQYILTHNKGAADVDGHMQGRTAAGQ